MNIMNRVTWKSMWENKTRTIVTIIGIVLSAAMFTAVTTMAFSFWSFLVESEVYNTGDYFLRYDYTSEEYLEELAEDDRVSQLGDLKILGYHSLELQKDGGFLNETVAVTAGDDAFFDMVTVQLEEGRLPESSDELVINRNTYHYLQQSGKGCEVGDMVTLELMPDYQKTLSDGSTLPSKGTTFTKTYTIVGIAQMFTRLGDNQLAMSQLFTYADGNEEQALWHRAFVKTWFPNDANVMHREAHDGLYTELNTGLLEFYGATQYTNYNNLIALIGGVFLLIIMVGSVSLIYNAFAISVAERMKQFGLLASVGATRKQLRRCIYFEALSMSGMGIPVGIVLGYGAIALTMEVLKNMMNQWISNGGIILRAVPSVWAFLAAGVIAVMTVLISAWIPARRAMKIAPISAIRQVQDYKIPRRGLKTTGSAWGLPGLLAKKYYTVSKKKYRSTVISITISILLFISATGVVNIMQSAADRSTNVNNFDMRCIPNSAEEVEDLRVQDFVERSALYQSGDFITVIPVKDQARDYLAVFDSVPDAYIHMSRGVKYLDVLYMEDSVFVEYLEEHGIDPEPYLNPEDPVALVMRPCIEVLTPDLDTGSLTLSTYETDLVAQGVTDIEAYPRSLPDEVRGYLQERLGEYSYMMDPTEDRLVFAIAPYQQFTGGIATPPNYDTNSIRVAVVAEGDVFAYYLYDAETDSLVGEPLCTVSKSGEVPQFRLGTMIDETMFGLYESYRTDEQNVTVILPMSALEQNEGMNLNLNLSCKINDYEAATAYLTENQIPYDDLLASERQARDLILMINVFSYGFIILITMISVANVFNTITTNIALRRRDFGMLRSVGMKTGEVYRMMGFECLSYGSRALLWGLPIGLLMDFGIQRIGSNVSNADYGLPLGVVVIVVISVFLIVFATTFYAVSKLRKDNPIDAIRMENT